MMRIGGISFVFLFCFLISVQATLPPNSTATYVITSFHSSSGPTTGRTITTTTTTRTTATTATTTTTTTAITITTTTITTNRPSVANTTVIYNPDTCSNWNYSRLMNGTCVTKLQAQAIATDILSSNQWNTTDGCYALTLYIESITNNSAATYTSNSLSVADIDHTIYEFGDINITINSNSSFLTVQQPQCDDNVILLGASFQRGIGGRNVDTTNKQNITTSFISVAGIIDQESLSNVVSLKMFIIDLPTGYEHADNKSNKTLASSVIVANLRRNNLNYTSTNIFLYFTPLNEYKRTDLGEYRCSFYDTNTSQWNESGCTSAQYNADYERYECTCNHLTSFALVWLPQTITTTTTKSFDAQDIVSLVAQLISIVCFIIIIIHAIYIRMSNPLQRLHTLKLLPLLSTASTTVLFIFFIALTLTVYTETTSSDENECFLSSKILMFITYFSLVFMFCVKTSVGYFYYLRFVRLFPQPSHRQLFIMLITSFLISLITVLLVIGLQTNSSLSILQLYPYQICWFTRRVVYYFLLIPIGLCLSINIITLILVAKSIIAHASQGNTSQQRAERFKRCVIMLLSSALMQGIGWLFGPFISLLNPTAEIIFEWIFIIVNAFEGLWSIIIYSFIRQRQMDEQKHVLAAIKLTNSGRTTSDKEKNLDRLFKDIRLNN